MKDSETRECKSVLDVPAKTEQNQGIKETQRELGPEVRHFVCSLYIPPLPIGGCGIPIRFR